MNLLETESYADVLSKGRRRKRPKLDGGVSDLASLVAKAEVRKAFPVPTGPRCSLLSRGPPPLEVAIAAVFRRVHGSGLQGSTAGTGLRKLNSCTFFPHVFDYSELCSLESLGCLRL